MSVNYFAAGVAGAIGAGAAGTVFVAAFSTFTDCVASAEPEETVKFVIRTKAKIAIEKPQVNCSTKSPVFFIFYICVAPADPNSPLIPPPLGF